MQSAAGLAIVVVIVFFALIGTVTAAALLPAQVGVDVEDGNLVIRLRGLDVLWCLRSSLTVPLDAVRGVRVADRSELPRPGLRLPGASVPGLITAGSYGIGEDRTFWDVRKAHRALEITCRPGHGYRALILEPPDPDAVERRLRPLLDGGSR
jgi:hypothetical protein